MQLRIISLGRMKLKLRRALEGVGVELTVATTYMYILHITLAPTI